MMRQLLLTMLLAPAVLTAQQPDVTPHVDRVFQRFNADTSPGCAVGVARGGAVVLARGYGRADLETGRPITPETIFESGSVAKQFTATAVVLLALDGKLDLDDPVRKYVPELPDYGHPLTIRHLLTHTSGLREWSGLVDLQGWPRGSRVHRQADLLDVVTRQRALNHVPGQFYSYTNSGYGLLFTIVERASGQPFARFTAERIFQPLGMRHTRWRDDFTRLTPGRAQAYSREPDGWHLEMPFENVVGPGGLLTTVGDLLIWNAALANRTPPLGAAVVDSLGRRPRLAGGRESAYGFGLAFTRYRGVPEISHGGATAGYRTFLARFPDHGLSIAVMCNAANANAGALAHAVADSLITGFQAVALDTAAVDSAWFGRYAGVYRHERLHTPLLLERRAAAQFRRLPDGSLYRLESGSRVVFDTAPAGAPRALRIFQPEGDTARFLFAAAQRWTPAAAQLAAFVGTYRSDELGVTYRVGLAGDTLTVSPRPGLVRKFRPSYEDGFVGEGVVWFERDRRGRVTALHFSQSRIWNLVAPRVAERR